MKPGLIAFFFTALFFAAFSQSVVTVNPISGNMSKGINNGFAVEIPQAGVKDISRDWKHRLTAGNKARIMELNGEISVRGLENKDIAPRPFNLYSIITSSTRGVMLTAWFTYNDTVFFGSEAGSSELRSASKFLHDFAAAEYFITVKNIYFTERGKLEKMKDDLEKSIRQQERDTLKITDNKRAIARTQDDLVTNDNDQKEATTAVNLQQAQVNRDRNANAEMFNAANRELTELQDNVKKLKTRNDELHRKIDEWNKENITEERNITTSKQDEAKTTDAIEMQKLLIKELAVKLKAIKA